MATFAVVEFLPMPVNADPLTGIAKPIPVPGELANPLASYATQGAALSDAVSRTSDLAPQYGPLVGVVQTS